MMNKKIKLFGKTISLATLLTIITSASIVIGAWVVQQTDESIVAEPFTVIMTDDLADIKPGESDTVVIRVSNSATVDLYANVTDTITITDADPDGDGYLLTTADITLSPTYKCLLVPAAGSTDFSFTVSLAPDAEPGTFNVTFDTWRVSAC